MAQEENSSRAEIDWEKIEPHWRAGIRTKLEISNEFGVSRAAMDKHFKKLGIERDLTAKIQAKAESLVAQLRRNSKPGFVYVITFDSGDGERFYKIGMSDDPVKRLENHQCASPFDMRIVVSYFTGNMSDEERELHSMFNSVRVRGEWFELSKNDLVNIAKRSVAV